MVRRAVAWILVSAVVGWLLAQSVTAVLDLRVEDKQVIAEAPHAAELVTPADAPAIGSLALVDDPMVVEAARVLGDAMRERNRPEPQWVSVADRPTLTVRVDEDGPAGAEASRLVAVEDERWVLHARTAEGAAQGLVALADRIRSGREPWVTEPLVPELSLRMVDFGAVGVRPAESQWRGGADYTHASRAFDDVILPEAPYVDTDALERHRAGFERFVRQSLAHGYNAMAVPGFLEYVRFDDLPAASDEQLRARATAMRDAFGPWWQYASERGLDVYLRTDMLALTDPLEQYLTDRLDGLDTASAALWQTYGTAFDEVYAALPQLAGTVVRIGEAGGIYDGAGEVRSELAVTSVTHVRAMLTGLLEAHERADRELVFRTWSVGIGDAGDLHTDPDTYREVFDGIDSERLVVSTKYVAGDFYSFLPVNPTLAIPGVRRIVEFQSRREYEGMGVLPNDLTALHAAALRDALSANADIEGVWTWTQDGGPWRAGPMALYLVRGWWPMYDLNTYAIGRLARDPEAAPEAITGDWIRSAVSVDRLTQQRVADAMAQSREALATGLYIGPYAEHTVRALGLEPPPMMWIFEWDVLAGDTATWSVLHAVVGDDLDRAVAEGRAAVATARSMLSSVRSTVPGAWHDPHAHDQVVAALEYQLDLFELLDAYRTAQLMHLEWVASGDDTAARAAERARANYRDARSAHVARYGDDVDLPAYNTVAADASIERESRDRAIAIAASVLLGLVVGWLLLGAVAALTRWHTGLLGLARHHWTGVTRPWAVRPDRSPLALAVVPALVVAGTQVLWTWGAAPVQWALSAAAWASFLLVLALATDRRARRRWAAAVGGAALVRSAVCLFALREHGPTGYWYAFWTDPSSRTVYIVVAVITGAWVLASAGFAARRAGAVLLAVGAALLVTGGGVFAVGLEEFLTRWNDQMGLLPWSLSRTLGLTTHLGIPEALPLYVFAGGAVLALAGIVRTRVSASPH
ncbi:hypothetical protein D9V41_11080 [Aeromicrobium phragmitis]|uniref:Uncharacterized protein n=1 Tax=Aeromicrobium phragmitis TaxID=2478914 RepID=A0A3L8PJP3_9ACTN|nr:hypothetical protein [Aeromicrobium phragmitis]RLV55616.1 hypothetical protein D9V41_11080 [Aeromicrobium phragmitis]